MVFLLSDRELLDLGEGVKGVRIECQGGHCWLTQAGDSRDHILGHGDAFTVRAGGRLIISATGSCRLVLRQAPQHAGRPLSLLALRGALRNSAAGLHP